MKATFHEKDSHAMKILERIHTDLCGPFSVASTAKHRYYVICVDDFSRKCWIFFMQKKSETFISGKFKDFCSTKGIRRELITPHNPQQNGVVEQKKRTIVGAARAMLHDQGLPIHLWVEACNTAVYV